MHLFLEGPVKAGKSTFLRKNLHIYSEFIGGFSCQRLWENGQPCGYRLVPADEQDLDAEFSPELAGIFTCHTRQLSMKDPSVFETLGVSLLKQAADKKLILLDEIGGSELLVPPFRQALYEVLDGPVPCIGVLKLPASAQFMQRASGYPAEVTAQNRVLRETLSHRQDVSLLPFSRENTARLQREIDCFLGGIF